MPPRTPSAAPNFTPPFRQCPILVDTNPQVTLLGPGRGAGGAAFSPLKKVPPTLRAHPGDPLQVMLHVQTNNDEAIAFYKRFGFEVVDEVKDYYKRIEPPGRASVKESWPCGSARLSHCSRPEGVYLFVFLLGSGHLFLMYICAG